MKIRTVFAVPKGSQCSGRRGGRISVRALPANQVAHFFKENVEPLIRFRLPLVDGLDGAFVLSL